LLNVKSIKYCALTHSIQKTKNQCSPFATITQLQPFFSKNTELIERNTLVYIGTPKIKLNEQISAVFAKKHKRPITLQTKVPKLGFWFLKISKRDLKNKKPQH
jgi:hypothetical protein